MTSSDERPGFSAVADRMRLKAGDPAAYLAGDEVIEVQAPLVRRLAADLRADSANDEAFAGAAFEWVRDRIRHSVDAQDPRVTLTATEVLTEGVGLCFAKSHLLAAVLRAGGIPTGFCYQRLADGDTYLVHGLVAVHLNGAWHRQDPRGNKVGVDAQFSVNGEQLAWPTDSAGEVDYPEVWVTPAPEVVASLRAATDALELCASGLPSTIA
jgi:transglutaminase-like putative cysteine protease